MTVFDNEYILDKYMPIIEGLAFARTKSIHDAEDITQEVFLRYIKYKPCLATEDEIKYWLIRAALNRTSSFFWFKLVSQNNGD